MGIYLLFIIGLVVVLFIVNKLTFKKQNDPNELILDQPNSISLDSYISAKKRPMTLIRTGVALIGIDVMLALIIINGFDLNDTEPYWENWFATLVMVILPGIALFLIIRGYLKLNHLKKQYNNRI